MTDSRTSSGDSTGTSGYGATGGNTMTKSIENDILTWNDADMMCTRSFDQVLSLLDAAGILVGTPVVTSMTKSATPD